MDVVVTPEPQPLPASGAPPSDASPSRKIYLVAAVVLVAVAVGAVLFAGHTDPNKIAPTVNPNALPVLSPAPAVNPVGGWLNSPPLTPADLAGKVVIYDFWTYSCINCVRTIPYLAAWNQRYGSDGLVIIGIESPEFDFEKVKSNVVAADARLGVTWPVALDNDMAVWNAFNTEYWPTKDITDRQGRLRYQDFGEGQYTQTEDVIRTLLGVPAGSPRATAPSAAVASANASGDGDITGETYLGTAMGNEGAQSGEETYPSPGQPADDTARLGGAWTGESEEVTADTVGSEIVLNYHARQVNLTLAPPGPPNGAPSNTPPGAPGTPALLRIELDGQPLPLADRTSQTMVAADGSTYIDVSADDSYRLVLGSAIQRHTLTLIALTPGIEAFDFTFGA